jgi:SAM-dependent methyltransferase
MDEARAYREQLEREARHWGDRLKVETVEANAWLDHPFISEHYRRRALMDGLRWDEWVPKQLGGPAAKSYELGCGSAGRSMLLFENGWSRHIDGLDVSPDRVAEGERRRASAGAPGRLEVGDVNTIRMSPDTYDLIFSCHSFHHFQKLEHVMDQVQASLTPNGYFVLEEFVGPTQFQWTDAQIDVVRSLTSLIPERLRRFRWGTVKPYEGRPTRAAVVAVSPFESIRSGEIVGLFERYFDVVAVRTLGGTLQHLLYNGIIHNFRADDVDALACLRGVFEAEDALIDSGLLPSDFQLLVGQRKRA